MITVHHEDKNSNNRAMSQAVFRKFGSGHVADGLQPGIFVNEDFIANPTSITAGEHRQHVFSATGADAPTEMTGVATMSRAVTETGIVQTPIFCKIASVSSNAGNILGGYEARLKITDISNVIVAVGLTDETPSTVFTAGVWQATKQFFGFVTDANGVIKAFRDNVQIGSDAETAFEDDTWIKFGIRIEDRYDGTGPRVIFYINGAKVSELTTKTDSGFAAAGDLQAFVYMYCVTGTNLLRLDRSTYYGCI